MLLLTTLLPVDSSDLEDICTQPVYPYLDLQDSNILLSILLLVDK